jgi:hypothetical protein
MKSQALVPPSVLFAAALVLSSRSYPACPPISGHLAVGLRNIYPEGADFSPSNCKIYIG